MNAMNIIDELHRWAAKGQYRRWEIKGGDGVAEVPMLGLWADEWSDDPKWEYFPLCGDSDESILRRAMQRFTPEDFAPSPVAPADEAPCETPMRPPGG